MLDDLVQTIETLKTRIEKHRAYLSEGKAEARTRTALIDPMLCALGWDVADPGAVEIEPRTDEGWADYALLGSNGKAVIFVEAKKLSENVRSHAKQSVNYAVGENLNRSPKIQYCALTNGDVWQVYDVLSQDLILEASVSSPDSAKSALRFLGLWRRSLQDGGFDTAVEPLVEVENGDGPVPPPPPPDWVPLTGELNASWQNQPSRMRLPDGEEVETPSWREVIRAITRWLQVKNMLTASTDLSASDIGTFIRSDGGTFQKPMQMEDGIVLNGNYSGQSHVRHAIRLLQHCKQDPSQILIRLHQ